MLDSLLAFIGIPDWRSALLAALLTLPWLVLLSRGWLRSAWLWGAVALAALLFPPTIAWVQVPLQQVLNILWTSLLDLPTIQRYVLLIGIPSLLVASAVQEVAKLLVAVLALRRLGQPRRPLAGLALGAAAGAGYGGFEAFWVFNQVFALGWSWATVELGGPVALLPLVERFFVVPFHVALTALAGYGYTAGRPWRFLLLAIALHTLGNYAVLLVQAGALDLIGAQFWIAAVALAPMRGAIWLRRRLAASTD